MTGKVKLGADSDAPALQGLVAESTPNQSVQTLPICHKDPFDRLIIAQGQAESLPILSRDPAFDDYAIRRLWI